MSDVATLMPSVSSVEPYVQPPPGCVRLPVPDRAPVVTASVAALETAMRERMRRDVLIATGQPLTPLDGRSVSRAARQQIFLDAYTQCGTVSHAAAVASVDVKTVRNWQRTERFAARMAEAQAAHVQSLYWEAVRRAKYGVVEPDGYYTDKAGNRRVNGYIVKHSDSLLQFILRGVAPETFGDKRTIEQRVDVGANILLHTTSGSGVGALLDRLSLDAKLAIIDIIRGELGDEALGIPPNTLPTPAPVPQRALGDGSAQAIDVSPQRQHVDAIATPHDDASSD